MRFESFLWTLIAALVLSWSGVETGTAPVTDDGGQFQAADGSSDMPPPPTTQP